MRIGILTLPLHTNYGGILQAYALQTVLERMGHNVIVLDRPYIFHISFWKKCIAYPKRLFCKYILQKNVIVRREKYTTLLNLTKRKNTQKFIEKYIRRKEICSFYDLDSNSFDAIVVGSDQIWRPLYFSFIGNAFLDFAKDWNIKRIAYAPSFGVDEWEYNENQTEICRNLLQKFDAISVREQSGVNLCSKYLKNTAEWVLDPTMLLHTEDYIKLFVDAKTPKVQSALFCYILDPNNNKQQIIQQLIIQYKQELLTLPLDWEEETMLSDNSVKPPVEQWLRCFYDANLVVTDSFHACVFSILFKKDFFVIPNKERGISRIESLLRYFGLENRIVWSLSGIKDMCAIDYESVYDKLENMRIKSMAFLNNALS